LNQYALISPAGPLVTFEICEMFKLFGRRFSEVCEAGDWVLLDERMMQCLLVEAPRKIPYAGFRGLSIAVRRSQVFSAENMLRTLLSWGQLQLYKQTPLAESSAEAGEPATLPILLQHLLPLIEWREITPGAITGTQHHHHAGPPFSDS
jgi:hypothetical protein